MARYRLVIRAGARVKKAAHPNLDSALRELERAGRELERSAHAEPVGGGLLRRIEPAQQVSSRIELKGPRGLRGGVDVRGDGSSEAWTGRVRRELITQRGGESAYDALRRELS